MTGVRERVFSGCSLHCSMVGVGALLAAALGLGLASAPGHGQLPGSNWRVSPEPVFAVGRVDGPAEEMFSRIGGAVRLSDGRFVVADERELRIRVYSASGRRLSAFGSEGEGPGEFRTIRGIWNVPGDTLGVWDSSIQRITRFLPDGKVIGTASLRFDAAGSSVPRSPLDAFLGAFSDGRIALTWITARRVPPGRLEPDRMVFGLFDANGQIRPDVDFAQLAEFVWFAETGTGFTGMADSPLLGAHEGRAVYLLYNGILKDRSVAGGNVLTGPVFDLLPTFDGPKVIYAAANRMGARAAREGITFKQTPYALEV